MSSVPKPPWSSTSGAPSPRISYPSSIPLTVAVLLVVCVLIVSSLAAVRVAGSVQASNERARFRHRRSRSRSGQPGAVPHEHATAKLVRLAPRLDAGRPQHEEDVRVGILARVPVGLGGIGVPEVAGGVDGRLSLEARRRSRPRRESDRARAGRSPGRARCGGRGIGGDGDDDALLDPAERQRHEMRLRAAGAHGRGCDPDVLGRRRELGERVALPLRQVTSRGRLTAARFRRRRPRAPRRRACPSGAWPAWRGARRPDPCPGAARSCGTG